MKNRSPTLAVATSTPAPTHAPIHKAYGVDTQQLGDREVRIVISTDQIDRSGDVVVQSGVDVENFKASRTVLWNHDQDHPVGSCTDIAVKQGRLEATVMFAPAGVSAKADEICGLVKAGVINAASIGFLPLEVEPTDGKNPRKGLRIMASELLEFSFVSVPANPGAQVIQRSLRDGRGVDVTWGVNTRVPATKGLNGCADLIWIFRELSDQVECAMAESAREGDGSDIPDRLHAVLIAMGAILVDMTKEEVGELLAPDGEAAAAQPPGGGAMEPMATAIAGLRKALDTLRAKSGREISAANAETMRTHLKAIGDGHQALCAMVEKACQAPKDDDADGGDDGNGDGSDPVDDADGGDKRAKIAAERARARAKRLRELEVLRLKAA